MIALRSVSLVINRALGGKRGETLSGRLYGVAMLDHTWRGTAASYAVWTLDRTLGRLRRERAHCHANYCYDAALSRRDEISST